MMNKQTKFMYYGIINATLGALLNSVPKSLVRHVNDSTLALDYDKIIDDARILQGQSLSIEKLNSMTSQEWDLLLSKI